MERIRGMVRAGWEWLRRRFQPDFPPVRLEHVRRLRLDPEDILVVKCPHRVTPETAQRIKEQAMFATGGHQRIMVIDQGMDIEVLRRRVKRVPIVGSAA
jgi:hypothetical protein